MCQHAPLPATRFLHAQLSTPASHNTMPQALEAIKVLSGVGDPLSRRLLVVDCAAGRFHTVRLRAK